MIIRFFSRFPMGDAVTGGQVYDNNILSILKNMPDLDADCQSLENVDKQPAMYYAPLVYILNGLKHKNADIFLFNSSLYMRFLPLLTIFTYVLRKKTMVIHHHFLYREFHGIKRLIYKRFEWRFLKQASHIIVPSPYVYSELKKKIPEKKLLLWKIPFDAVQQFKPSPIAGNLTYTGTIEPRKGLIYLLEAINILKKRNIEYRLCIIGKTVDEDYKKTLDNFISDNNLNVVFTGFISKKEKEQYLSESDVFVFPSLLEGFGMVLVEAQVYELPIVCFDNSAMPYSVFDGINGFTVPDKDYVKFADAIQKIITDRSLRSRMSAEAGKNVIRQATTDSFKKEVEDYFIKMS